MPVVSSYRRITASTKTNQDRDKYARNRGESGIIGRRMRLITTRIPSVQARNWTVLEFTGEYCNVSPFSTEYAPLENVPVARCATVYTFDSTGTTVLLIADQVLWFGTNILLHL
jgi:hypothetical protein